jgi:predicted Rossmann-fold nucleotide-binding protein
MMQSLEDSLQQQSASPTSANDAVFAVSEETKQAIASHPFASTAPDQDHDHLLRVCCYGSSSSRTPVAYLNEAYQVGYLLGSRNHICINGAGSFGCMAALNQGASDAGGHIVGVIHEMWLASGEQPSHQIPSSSNKYATNLRDGGAHAVFHNGIAQSAPSRRQPIREMLVAGGKDLQERKRLLVENADALIVLPGGPGTWDEVSPQV